MSDLSAVLGWQFSFGFVIKLVAGGALVMRAAALARRDAVSVGYRGYTPPNVGRRILPQGGSGTAKPRRPCDSDTGEYPAAR